MNVSSNEFKITKKRIDLPVQVIGDEKIVFKGKENKVIKDFKESEECWKKILEFSENDNAALSNLGVVFAEQKRYAEAEEAYRNAIAKDPNSAATYNNLAILLRVTNQAKDALPVLQQLIEINPEDFNPYLGIVSIKKALGESIELSFIEKARLYIPEDDFYNRACLVSICDNFDLAFEYLQKAVQKEGFNFTWAWKDPDLQWIRDDPRFIEIVGPKPENENSEI